MYRRGERPRKDHHTFVCAPGQPIALRVVCNDMRNAAIVLALVALPAFTYAAPVNVKRPHIIYRTGVGVSAACKASNPACTTVSAEFFCGCELRGRAWLLVPKIIAQPTIYTTSEGYMRHELEHLADIRESLNTYAASLLVRSFPSAGACNDFVAAESKAFPSTMRSIERATTIRRDGVRFAGPVE